jgi:hypothetical protein
MRDARIYAASTSRSITRPERLTDATWNDVRATTAAFCLLLV